MRLPLTAQINTRDGISNKDARLTNVLKEAVGDGEAATVRPGLTEVISASGIGTGKGIVSFNGELVSVYGTNLYNMEYIEYKNQPVVPPLAGLWAVTSDETTLFAVEWFITGKLYSSTDGRTWALLGTISTLRPLLLAYTELVFVGINATTTDVTTSLDFITWTSVTVPTTYVFVQVFRGVVGGGGRFCLVGSAPRAYTSTDGLSWTESVIGFGNFFGIAYKDGTFCAITSYRSITSTDGVTWVQTGETPNPDFTNWRYIAASDQTFLAVSNSYTEEFVWLSSDGLTWEAVPFVGKNIIYVGWTGTAFCAITIEGEVLKSNDGRVWVSKGMLGFAPTGGIGGDINGNVLAFGNTSLVQAALSINNYNVRPVSALSGDFFDFAQSTL